MPGFDNKVMWADNVRFDGAAYPGEVTTNGQLLIGSTVAPNIRVGTLTSADSSVTITPGAGTIDLSAGGGVSTTYDEDSGTATPAIGVLNVIGGTSVSGTATNINTIGSGSTVEVCLNNSISQPTTNAAGTAGVYSLGAHRFMHNYGAGGLGDENTFLGDDAGNLTLTGNLDTGIGYHALRSLTTGYYNVTAGSGSGENLTNSHENVAIGAMSLNAATTGSSFNVGIGSAALGNCASCGQNVAIGSASMVGGVTSSPVGNVAIGYGTMSGLTSACYNIAIGLNSMTSATTAASNTSVGTNSCAALATAINHTAIGQNTLYNMSASEDDTAIGTSAMQGYTSGSFNVAVGSSALYGSGGGTGGWNTAIGVTACRGISSGNYNSALGGNALYSITTGSNNVCLGYNSASSYVGGESSNIIISAAGTVAENNVIRIGTQGSGAGQQNACYIAGIASVATSNSQTVTIDSTTGQLGSKAIQGITTWTAVGVSGALANNHGYLCTTGAALSFSLPATAAIGTQIGLVLAGSTSWTITQGAGQSITISPTTSTPGVGGSVASLTPGTTLTLICDVADTHWTAIATTGTFTIV